MFRKARSGRDAFTFSLRGTKATASFGPLPPISDDYINSVIDQRMSQAQTDSRDVARRVEDLLARHFAPGRVNATQAPGRQIAS